jgi:hypothetical protein
MRTYSVSSDVKRAIFSKGFLFGILGMVLMIVIASLSSISSLFGSNQALPNGYHASLILKALSSQDVTLVLPILCTLPFTAAFVDDIKCGFIKPYLQRSGVNKYIQGKLIACGLSGGLVLFLGIVAAYGLSALIFTPMELALSHGQIAQPYFAQVLMIAAMFFLSGAFWSLVGCTLAALTMSRYMAYASPFIMYYVLIILHERYFQELYVFYPKEWLYPSVSWILGSFGVILLLAELTAIICLAFIITAKRRLRNV